MGVKKTIIKTSIAAAKLVTPEFIELGAKIGNDLYEQQKSLIKIPNLKDINFEEAIRILKDELQLLPIAAIAKPSASYADDHEFEVVYSEPKFGSKVNVGTAVKIYYLTHEVIEKSKFMLKDIPNEFKTPKVVGINISEAKEDLENLGLRITQKLEKAHVSFADKENGYVTRITYPDEKNIGSRLKSNDRIWVFYLNDEVIQNSKTLVQEKEENYREILTKLDQGTKDIVSNISESTKNTTKKITDTMSKPFSHDLLRKIKKNK